MSKKYNIRKKSDMQHFHRDMMKKQNQFMLGILRMYFCVQKFKLS